MRSLMDVYLALIEGDAEQLRYYAMKLERHAPALTALPDFRTRAEADLERAEQAVASAKQAFANLRQPKLVAAE